MSYRFLLKSPSNANGKENHHKNNSITPISNKSISQSERVLKERLFSSEDENDDEKDDDETEEEDCNQLSNVKSPRNHLRRQTPTFSGKILLRNDVNQYKMFFLLFILFYYSLFFIAKKVREKEQDEEEIEEKDDEEDIDKDDHENNKSTSIMIFPSPRNSPRRQTLRSSGKILLITSDLLN